MNDRNTEDTDQCFKIIKHWEEQIEQHNIENHQHLKLNLDLKAATNHINKDVIDYILLKLETLTNVPDRTFRRMNNETTTYKHKQYIRKSGIGMGVNLSFTVLTICNEYALHMASIYTGIVMGDDMTGHASVGQTQHYIDALRSVGFIINETKTIYSKDTYFFCEKMYRIKRHHNTARKIHPKPPEQEQEGDFHSSNCNTYTNKLEYVPKVNISRILLDNEHGMNQYKLNDVYNDIKILTPAHKKNM